MKALFATSQRVGLTMASTIDASPRLNCRTAEYRVATHVRTDRKEVMTRNQVITLTSGPWFTVESHSGASVVVRLEMVLMMSMMEDCSSKAVAALFPAPGLVSSQPICMPAPPKRKIEC